MPDHADLAASMLDELRIALRVSTDSFDAEILMLAESALNDMERIGIRPDYIEEMGARVRNAVVCYVKAGFGFDNADARMFDSSYRQIIADMSNSYENEAFAEVRPDV